MTETPAKALPLLTFADAEARLAESLPGYETRLPQQRLAAGVERLFANPEHFTPAPPDADHTWEREGLIHFLGQAGTGVGKSLGYLIPALLSGKRVVVSVTTKALQDQLAGKDLPFLEEHLGVDFTWCLLKGRSNYLCLNRLALCNETEVSAYREILELSKDPDFDGLRESVPFEIAHSEWYRICSDSEDCSSLQCNGSSCYAARARGIASTSNLIVANHALFFTDLMLKTYGVGGMLGDYDAVVFDEAHEIEEIAGNTLGGELSEGTFGQLMAEVRNWSAQYADEGVDPFVEPMGDLQRASHALFSRLENGRLRQHELNEVVEELANVFDATEALRAALHAAKIEHTPDYRRASQRKFSLMRRCNSAVDRLTQVIADPFEDTVRWVETERTKAGHERKVIKIAPILVAPFLHRNLFTKVPTVLVSATLAVKGRFDYITGRLGIGAHEGLDVGTPFDFATQARLYVPLTLPEPKGADQQVWQAMANEEILRLITASRGRALVLFTSVAHMRQAYEATARRTHLDLRMQGQAPTQQLVAWLKDHNGDNTGKVLFATKSFFTGVDISGEALSLVVVAKMPFPVPTEPLTEARCQAIEAAGGSSFTDYTVPVMSLVLQQAAGRLIRHRSDTGVVAILDPRIVSKGYGKQILRDLPPMTQTFSLDEVAAFLS